MSYKADSIGVHDPREVIGGGITDTGQTIDDKRYIERLVKKIGKPDCLRSISRKICPSADRIQSPSSKMPLDQTARALARLQHRIR